MMTINQIRKEAPEGATHYDNEGEYWDVSNGDYPRFYRHEYGGWIPYIFTLDIAVEEYKLTPL